MGHWVHDKRIWVDSHSELWVEMSGKLLILHCLSPPGFLHMAVIGTWWNINCIWDTQNYPTSIIICCIPSEQMLVSDHIGPLQPTVRD